MNGGTININGNLSLGTSVVLTGSGTCNLGNNTLSLGTADTIWTSTIDWKGTLGTLDTLNNSVSLASTWTIDGNITILGNNLARATSVSFNGIAAEFKVVSATEITATVPAGATSRTVQVITPSGIVESNVAFRVNE